MCVVGGTSDPSLHYPIKLTKKRMTMMMTIAAMMMTIKSMMTTITSMMMTKNTANVDIDNVDHGHDNRYTVAP